MEQWPGSSEAIPAPRWQCHGPGPPQASVLTRSTICRGQELSTPPSLVWPSCFDLTPKYSTWGMSLGTLGPWGA